MWKIVIFSATLAGVLLTAAPVRADGYSWSYSSTYPTQRYDTSRERLNDMDNAQQRLSNAPVKDISGDTVGRVTDMDTDERGDVEAIQVSLNDSDNPVSIPAEEVRFDRDGDVVRADLTWSQIHSMSNSQTPYTYDEY